MTVDELKAKLDAGEKPCVVDVREARELAVAQWKSRATEFRTAARYSLR